MQPSNEDKSTQVPLQRKCNDFFSHRWLLNRAKESSNSGSACAQSTLQSLVKLSSAVL